MLIRDLVFLLTGDQNRDPSLSGQAINRYGTTQLIVASVLPNEIPNTGTNNENLFNLVDK